MSREDDTGDMKAWRERGVNTPGREDRMQLEIEPHSEEFLERRVKMVKKGSTNWQLYWGY